MNQAITFQYTFEEFSEGVTAIQKSTRQLLTPKMGAGGFIWMLAFLVAFVVMMMFAVPYGRGAAPATGDPAPATAANRAMSYVAPALPWDPVVRLFLFSPRDEAPAAGALGGRSGDPPPAHDHTLR